MHAFPTARCRGYLRFSKVATPGPSSIVDLFLAQNGGRCATAWLRSARFQERVRRFSGNLKFDVPPPTGNGPWSARLRESLTNAGAGPVLVFAASHDGGRKKALLMRGFENVFGQPPPTR